MTTTADRLRTFWGERQFDRERLSAVAVRYWEVGLYVALVSAALGLRLWGLGARAVHHDEALHMYYAWQLFEGNGYEHVPFMHGPFQFFGSALIFRLFGDTDFTARLLYALFGAGLVALPFALRAFIGRTGALIAAFLLALSPSLLYFSRFARNDILIVFFTLALAVVVFRYLRERKEMYLLGVPLFLMLGFTTKEVTFITTAIFMVYLNALLADDLVNQMRAARPMRRDEIAIAYVLLIPTAWIVAALWPIIDGPRKRWGLDEMPASGHLVVVMGTFALPQFAAGVQKIPLLSLGDADVYAEAGDERLRYITTLSFLFASAYVGLFWNWRIWLLGAAIFYVPFILLYTTFFTNMGGFWTGIWGSLDYWLSQQLVRRGDQPDYYYLMQLPVYEFLPLIFATGGTLYYAFRGKLDQVLLSAAALSFIIVFALIPNELWLIGEPWKVSFGVAAVAVLLLSLDRFTKFLIFWSIAILFGLSVAGEKMPWLTVHLALPLILLAGKVIDDTLSSLGRPKEEPERRRAPQPSIVGLPWNGVTPLAYGGVAALLAALLLQGVGPASGVSVLAWLFALVAAGVVVWTARTVSWAAAGQVAAVALFGALIVFTARTAGTAAYDEGHPDGSPQELLIYAQGSPKLDVIYAEIRRLDREAGRSVPVLIDDAQNVWPWPWYFRDRGYTQTSFAGEFAPPEGAVVLVSVNNQDKMAPYLEEYHPPVSYTHMWWFPEFYRGVERGAFLADFFTGHYVSTWRTYFIDRRLPGAASSPDMLAFFPKSFEAPTFPTQPPGEREPAEAIPETAVSLIGAVGAAEGQFSQPADVTIDGEGNLYVVDSLNHRVQKIAPDGSVEVFGEQGGEAGQFANPREQSEEYAADGPWGVAVDGGGNIYVADTWNHRVQKFGPDFEFIASWGEGSLFGPRDIAIDGDGNVLVVDTGNNRVARYDTDGRFIDDMGVRGSRDGQFQEPSSIAIGPTGDVFVADYWGRRIQRFTANLQFTGQIEVSSWGSHGVTDRAFITVADTGHILASDPANDRILVFDDAGAQVAAWRLPPAPGPSRPVGIAVAGDGRVVIADSLNSRVVAVPLDVLLPAQAP